MPKSRKKFTRYLQDLVDDPALLKQHQRDPKGTAKGKGLSDADAELLAGKDVQAIRDRVLQDHPDVFLVAIVDGR